MEFGFIEPDLIDDDIIPFAPYTSYQTKFSE